MYKTFLRRADQIGVMDKATKRIVYDELLRVDHELISSLQRMSHSDLQAAYETLRKR